jgi:hypothetical protein
MKEKAKNRKSEEQMERNVSLVITYLVRKIRDLRL